MGRYSRAPQRFSTLRIAACFVLLLGLLGLEVEISPGTATAATTQPGVSVGADVMVGEGDGYVDLPIALNAPGTQTVTVAYGAHAQRVDGDRRAHQLQWTLVCEWIAAWHGRDGHRATGAAWFALFFPVRVQQLLVSVEDPDGLIAAVHPAALA